MSESQPTGFNPEQPGIKHEKDALPQKKVLTEESIGPILDIVIAKANEEERTTFTVADVEVVAEELNYRVRKGVSISRLASRFFPRHDAHSWEVRGRTIPEILAGIQPDILNGVPNLGIKTPNEGLLKAGRHPGGESHGGIAPAAPQDLSTKPPGSK